MPDAVHAVLYELLLKPDLQGKGRFPCAGCPFLDLPLLCSVFAGIIAVQPGLTADERISGAGFPVLPLIFFAIGMSVRYPCLCRGIGILFHLTGLFAPQINSYTELLVHISL